MKRRQRRQRTTVGRVCLAYSRALTSHIFPRRFFGANGLLPHAQLPALPVEKSKWCEHHWSCGPGAHCSVLFAVRMHTVCVWVCKHKRNTKQIGRVGECGAEVCGEGLVRSQCLYHHRFVSRARLMRLRCASSLDSPQAAWVRDVAVEVVAVGSWRGFELVGS